MDVFTLETPSHHKYGEREREREREVYRGIAEVVFPTNIIANVNVISSDNFLFFISCTD